MEFEWDEAKAASNFAKHGVKFSAAAVGLLAGMVVRKLDIRRDYGEDRWIALARVSEAILSIVYTTRSGSIRISAARRANRHEREAYEEAGS